ncbi:MAG: heparan-alpha-glucosaminide N-acetyltransferase domain-containing protein [Candidatus Izemoplasmatales bacterium]|jgi:uncharacterized membrane protein|nr:heparan-alpha-glucosaminide N-acetyltransferase domain-containing protein [Candidatus Izemoplasmatales bacterium]
MEKGERRRVWELDFLRGFAIIMMVYDHIMYDLKSLPNWFSNFEAVNNPVIEFLSRIALGYWVSLAREIGHPIFVAIFLLVSGISFNFSRSNLKRGLKFLVVAVLISLVTYTVQWATGGSLRIGILFGIIHMFAFGTLLLWLLRKIWNNDLFILAVGLGIIGLGISFHFWEVEYVQNPSLRDIPALMLGVKGTGADFFGIAPYAGVIMVGSALGKLLYPKPESLLPGFDKGWNRPFKFAGRHSFLIFITHQAVVFSLVYALMSILGYRM